MKSFLFAAFTLTLLSSLASCASGPGQGKPLSEAEKETFIQKGNTVALLSFTTLSNKLSRALKDGGVKQAAPYCNAVAIPAIDSLSRANGCTIRRTSMKVRNPLDAPGKHEQTMLEAYHSREKAGEELRPVVQPMGNDQVIYYAPIRISQPCLQCHGTVGREVSESDYAIIREMYPEDKAVGYGMGDLRGMWSITFRRNQQQSAQ